MEHVDATEIEIPATPAGVLHVQQAASTLGRVWRYVDRQLPPMQAAALCIVTLCSYAILGRIGHTTPWGWEIAAAAITTVLLFFQVRLVEDIDIHACGGELVANLGRRRELPRHPSGRVVLADGRLVPKPSTLLGALAFTIAIVVLLNAWIGRWALIAALVPTATSLVCVSLLRIKELPRFMGAIPFFELVPAMTFSYTYFVWAAAAKAHLSFGSVAAVVALWWLNWQYWKFSRGIGVYDIERIYGLRLQATRIVLVVLLLAVFGVTIPLYSDAQLSAIFLGYVACITAVFVISIVTLARWRRDGPPWWGGLALPNAIVLGVVVQLLALI
jgi:hypothetical protein